MTASQPTPRPTWEEATRAQYDDDANLAARQAMFAYLTEASPLAEPLSDLSSLVGQRVLDVGCGNGMFLTGAAGGGARAIGVDTSLGMVTVAAEASGAPVAQARAEAMPVSDGSIDVVLALWMLYHVADKPAALSEFRRILAPGGRLVAATNSAADDDLDRLVCFALGDVVGSTVDRWHPPLDFTTENGAEILATAFEEVEVHPFGNTFEVTDVEMLVRYVGSMLEPIAADHPDVEPQQLLEAVGRRGEAELAAAGLVRIERSGAVFIAR